MSNTERPICRWMVEIDLVALLEAKGAVKSRTEARRLILGGAVDMGGKKWDGGLTAMVPESSLPLCFTMRVGKHRVFNVEVVGE